MTARKPHPAIWADQVRMLDRMLKDTDLLMTQTDQIKDGLVRAKDALYSIYMDQWEHEDIGEPEAIMMMNTWKSPKRCCIQFPTKYMRTTDLFLRSVALDMLAVEVARLNQEEDDDIAPENA